MTCYSNLALGIGTLLLNPVSKWFAVDLELELYVVIYFSPFWYNCCDYIYGKPKGTDSIA